MIAQEEFRFDKGDGRALRLADDLHPDGLPLPPAKFLIHHCADYRLNGIGGGEAYNNSPPVTCSTLAFG